MDFKSILQGWANLTLDQIGALDPIIKKKAEVKLGRSLKAELSKRSVI